MLPYLTALFYFDGETALAACVLRATTKKVNFFEEKKCIRVTWLEDFLTSK